MTLYLLRYNNYYNRIVKKFDTLAEYMPYVLESFSNVTNFNPADGINTQQILNYEGDTPDYCLVCDSDNNIISRWFVLEADRTRAQQYLITLYRDTIVDYYNDIIDAPTFIEKATLTSDNPLIYNKENFSVNQIKTSEALLKDKSGCPWIVGYLARNDTTEELSAAFTYDPTPTIIVESLDQWEYYQYTTGTQAYAIKSGNIEVFYDTVNGLSDKISIGLANNNTDYESYNINIYDNGGFEVGQAGYVSRKSLYTTPLQWKNVIDYELPAIAKNLQIQNKTYSKLSAYFKPTPVYDSNKTIFDTFLNLNDKIIKDNSTGKIYRIQFQNYSFNTGTANIQSGALFNDYVEMINNLNKVQKGVFSNSPTINTFKVEVDYSKYNLKLWELQVVDYTDIGSVTLGTDRYLCSDAPYDLFCMPYADVEIYNNGVYQFTQYKDVSMAAAAALAAKYSGGQAPKLYDLQLLPFCPVPYYIESDGRIDYSGTNIGRLSTNDGNLGVVFYPKNSKFHTAINYTIPISEDPIEKKVQNECDIYRLCSPNYGSIFEFSAVKNNGVNYFDVDCTYMPINPYIHINPNFGGLYGKDYDDARGLICGGDFSLPLTSDAWEVYQRENKNYNETFNRQIENLEVQHDLQRERERWQIITGTLGGAAGGALAGSMIGGPIGAAVGATVGAGASLFGGAKDIELNAKLRNEALDYTRDQFGYQLGNIKALPNTLTRVTSFTNNNKLFPVLEYYTCTDIEKDAFKNKLKYNGMSVGIIDKISNYLKSEESYIKGKIIRIENIVDDYHVANNIASEINKGVFI